MRNAPEEFGCDGSPTIAEVGLQLEKVIFFLGSEGGRVGSPGEFVQVPMCMHAYRPRHCFSLQRKPKRLAITWAMSAHLVMCSSSISKRRASSYFSVQVLRVLMLYRTPEINFINIRGRIREKEGKSRQRWGEGAY